MLGMTEVRWKDQGDININSGDYRMIYLGGHETQCGVTLLLDKQTSQAKVEVDCCSGRLMVVRWCRTPVDLLVVVVYMPTSDHLDEEVEELYERIEEKLATCKGKHYLLVLGDINATVEEEKILNVVGNYGLGKRNTRGEMLVDFCMRNNLMITNLLLKKGTLGKYQETKGDCSWTISSSGRGIRQV